MLDSRIVELAQEQRRFGYWSIHALLRREVNHKHVDWLYSEKSLPVLRCKMRLGAMVPRDPSELPMQGNEVWSLVCVMDCLANECYMNILATVDSCTMEKINLMTHIRITGQYIIRIVDKAVRFWDNPKLFGLMRSQSLLGMY